MKRETLGKSEFVVMSVLARKPSGAHGTALLEELAKATGREMSVGALYTTLERLESKGYVSSAWGEPTPQRGGRRKRNFKVEAPGHRALHDTIQMFNLLYPTPAGLKPMEA